MLIKKQNLKLLLTLSSMLVGALCFYLLLEFIFTDSNIQRILLNTKEYEVFIPNYYTHAFKIFGIFFISCFTALICYQKISNTDTKNRVKLVLLITGIGCMLIYISLPFTVFKENSFFIQSLFSKKTEIYYSQTKNAVINSIITYYKRGKQGGCTLEHGISFPSILESEIVLRGNSHEKIKIIQEILKRNGVDIWYTSSIQKECAERFDDDYIDKLKNKLAEDLGY